MSETAGGCAVERQATVLDHLSKNYQQHQMVKREMRKNELAAKGEAGCLSTSEALQLAGYKMEDALGRIASLTAPNICYVA